jgi:hypothetical protein
VQAGGGGFRHGGAVRCGAVLGAREVRARGRRGGGEPKFLWGPVSRRSIDQGGRERGEGRRGMVAEVAGLGQDGPFGPVTDYYLLSGPI